MKNRLMRGGGGKPITPGIYAYSDSGKLVVSEDIDSAEIYIGVAIVTEEHQFIMGINQTSNSWYSGKLGDEKDILDIPNDININISDYNGIAYTKRILKQNPQAPSAKWCDSYNESIIPAGNWYLPTVTELLLIHKYILEVNAILDLINVPVLVNRGYWSSNETRIDEAKIVSIVSGIVTNTPKSQSYSTLACAPLPKYRHAILASNSDVGDYVYDDYTICKKYLTPQTDKVIGICYKVDNGIRYMINMKELRCPLDSTQQTMYWGAQYADIPTMTNYSSWDNTVFNGLEDTKKIITFRGKKDYDTWKPTYDLPIDYPAASVCDMYHVNLNKIDRTTWWLPSMGDMWLFHFYRGNLSSSLRTCSGDDLDDLYWTSCENDASFAYKPGINNMTKHAYLKSTTSYVRACATY